MTDMTDQELDRLMRHVLMDGVEQETETDARDIPAFQPSPRYQRQMAAMQRDPLAWSRKKQRPAWKKCAQTAAALLLAAGLGLAASPTARADIVRLRWSGTTRILSITTQVLTCLVKCRSIQFPLCRMGTKKSYAT